MPRARPDFRLPAPVEGLNGRLEPGLPRRGEDGDHPEAQAEAGHAADRVAVMMRALEDGIVVELDVRGEAERAPVLHEGVHHGLRRDP